MPQGERIRYNDEEGSHFKEVKNPPSIRRTSTHVESPVRHLHNQSGWTKKHSIAKILDDKDKEATNSQSEFFGPQAVERISEENSLGAFEELVSRKATKILDKSFQERFKKSSQNSSFMLLVMMGIELFYLAALLITQMFVNLSNPLASVALIVSLLSIVALVQIARYIEFKFKTALFSLYVYLIIYLAIVALSPNTSSPIILLLGFSMMAINCLQSSMIRLTNHMIAIFVLVAGTYLIKSSTMTTDCFAPGYCPTFQSTSIGPQLFWVAMCFFGLMIVLYIDREVHFNYQDFKNAEDGVHTLVSANLDLQNQLRVAKIKPETDIAAPLTRATQLLVAFQEKNRNTENDTVLKEVENILSILNSDKLFEPEFFQDTGDTDVTNFLQDVLQTKKITHFKTIAGPTKTTSKTSAKKQNQTQLMALLDTIAEPFFNIIGLEVMSEGHALYYTALTTFKEHDFQHTLGIPERTFCHWILKMELGYDRKNPYHNSSHAADVTQVMNYFISRPKLSKLLTVEETIACIIAAIGHDYMHPGFTNAFLIATRNPLALRYNDTSVLEHFHAASVAEIFGQSEFDLFYKVSAEQKRYIREMVITMIMATDMSFHFEWLSKFKNKLSTNSFNFENLNDKKLILNIAMKCADINNLTRPLEISRMWTQLVIEEFFLQGDQEKARGLPVSMFMDRNNTDIPKCQIGFIDYIVLPLYEAWSSFLPDDLDAHLENLKSNKAFWKGKSEQGQPIEKVFIPKFSVSVLRIRGSVSTPKLNSSHQRKKSDSIVSSNPPVSNPPSRRPSIITKIMRKFSVSSRVIPEVVAVQEEARDKQEESFDKIVILDGERKQSMSTENLSVLSKSEIAAIEEVEKNSKNSLPEIQSAQLVDSVDSEVSTEAPKKSEKEETSVQLADIAEAVRSNLEEAEDEPAEEFPRTVYSISKRRKSISYHDISITANTAKKNLDVNNPIAGSSTTSLLATNSSIVERSASVIGFDGFDAVENRSQASDLGTDNSLSPSI